MLKAVHGNYHDGIVELDEQPEDISEARVIVTFLKVVPSGNKTVSSSRDAVEITRLRGLLSGRATIPPATDPVREALEQLRNERTASIESCIDGLLNGQGGS